MLLPVLMFIAGVVLVAAAVATGEAEVSLLVIFPVFSGSGPMFLVGTALIALSFIAGFVLLAMGQAEVEPIPRRPPEVRGVEPAPTVEKKYGGFVLVGPFPIAFGSDKSTAMIMLIVGVVLAVILLGLLIALAQ